MLALDTTDKIKPNETPQVRTLGAEAYHDTIWPRRKEHTQAWSILKASLYSPQVGHNQQCQKQPADVFLCK